MPEYNTKDIIIREGRPEDLNNIISLLQQLWPDKVLNKMALKDTYIRSLELEGHIIRCAYYEDQVVGLCSLSIRNNLKAEGNLANIDELVVDIKYRGKQIGKMLLEDSEIIARKYNCKFIGLESSFHREDAHRFYEQNGFAKAGYYISKDLD